MIVELTYTTSYVYDTEDYDWSDTEDPIEEFKEWTWESIAYDTPEFIVTILSP